MKPLKCCLSILYLFFVLSLFSQSIVPQDFTGHLDRKNSVRVGDSFLVEITQDMQFKIVSVRSSSNSVTFELSGGEGSGLVSFLPAGQSSTSRVLKSEETVSLSTLLAVSVQEVTDNGLVRIAGSRILEAEGGRQELRLNGSVSLNMITPGTPIPFSQVIDAYLSYRSIASSADPRISESDLAQRSVPVFPDDAAALDEEAQGDILPDMLTEGIPVPVQNETVLDTLDEQKKRELFLLYINEFVRLIFM